jgi:hypothetical protein
LAKSPFKERNENPSEETKPMTTTNTTTTTSSSEGENQNRNPNPVRRPLFQKLLLPEPPTLSELIEKLQT